MQYMGTGALSMYINEGRNILTYDQWVTPGMTYLCVFTRLRCSERPFSLDIGSLLTWSTRTASTLTFSATLRQVSVNFCFLDSANSLQLNTLRSTQLSSQASSPILSVTPNGTSGPSQTLPVSQHRPSDSSVRFLYHFVLTSESIAHASSVVGRSPHFHLLLLDLLLSSPRSTRTEAQTQEPPRTPTHLSSNFLHFPLPLGFPRLPRFPDPVQSFLGQRRIPSVLAVELGDNVGFGNGYGSSVSLVFLVFTRSSRVHSPSLRSLTLLGPKYTAFL